MKLVAATLARAPYLQRVLAGQASVLWTTKEPGTGSVLVTGPGGGSIVFPASMRAFLPGETGQSAAWYQFLADVTGLSPGTPYTYQVAVDGRVLAGGGPQFSWRTPAAGKFSFLAFGDSGEATTQQNILLERMTTESGVALVLHVGDLAYQWGTFGELEDYFFSTNAALMTRLPFFTTPGNHEYGTAFAAPYLAVTAQPATAIPAADKGRYYSWDWGDAHFLSLDSNLLSTDAAGRMLAWADADLATCGKYWKIAFFHHPPYPTGFHRDDPLCRLAKEQITPLLESHGVQLVLSGHEHGYERTYPLHSGLKVEQGPSTTYVVTAGGGGEMEELGSLPEVAKTVSSFHYLRVDVDSWTVGVRAIDPGGVLIDQFSLAPPPAVAAGGVVSAGDFAPAIAPGSLAVIFGRNLAVRPLAQATLPLAADLGDVRLTAGGRVAPLLYVSPEQINFQVPYEVSGTVQFVVTTPNGTTAVSLNVTPTAPAILAVAAGSALVSSSNPVRAGDVVVLYVTGLGEPLRAVPTGQAAPLEAIPVLAPVEVRLDTTIVQPLFAGLAPGFAGLGQVNFRLPANLAPGIYDLRLKAGSALSAGVKLPIAG